MVNCYVYINVFPALELFTFFLYKIYGVHLSKRGKYRNVKAEKPECDVYIFIPPRTMYLF